MKCKWNEYLPLDSSPTIIKCKRFSIRLLVHIKGREGQILSSWMTVIRQFLQRFNSPWTEHSKAIINVKVWSILGPNRQILLNLLQSLRQSPSKCIELFTKICTGLLEFISSFCKLLSWGTYALQTYQFSEYFVS